MPEPLSPDNRGAPPASYTKELSPQEKNNALLQFMGSQYGEFNKLDGNVVGHSTSLGKGNSAKIKGQVAQVMENAQRATAPVAAPAPVTPPAVQPAQNTVHVAPEPVAVPPAPIDKDQLEFNFDRNEKEELFLMVEELIQRMKTLEQKIDNNTSSVSDLLKSVQNSKVTAPKKKSVNTRVKKSGN